MPYAIKKPHPTLPNVKVWHTWDPDGDGYECLRKFPDEATANAWVNSYHPGKGCEVLEVDHEIMQDDQQVLEAYNASMAVDSTVGLRNLANRDSITQPGPLTNFTINGELD